MKARCLLAGMSMTALLGCSINTAPEGSMLPSNKTVLLRVMAPDGAWIRASVAEGGMLRIRDDSTGKQVAFLPVITDPDENAMTITAYQTMNSSSQEQLVQVDSQLVALHSSKILPNSFFQILLEAITDRPPHKAQISTISLTEHSEAQKGNCCVTCNGMTYCSNCLVQTSCGCCNTEDCAGECGEPPKPNKNKNENTNRNKNRNRNRNKNTSTSL